MKDETRKEHWEKIYTTKKPNEVSWTQENPKTSLDFIHSFNLPKQASIIDVGGGDSKLVDRLLDEGYEDITVLDISEQALQRAKESAKAKAFNDEFDNMFAPFVTTHVNVIVSDKSLFLNILPLSVSIVTT